MTVASGVGEYHDAKLVMCLFSVVTRHRIHMQVTSGYRPALCGSFDALFTVILTGRIQFVLWTLRKRHRITTTLWLVLA